MDQRDKAALLRRLHDEPPILVLPNAWDVASAQALVAIPGCRALATSSAAVAGSFGWEDGEQAPVAEMIQANGRIAAAVDVPVTADLEAGYGDPVGTARAAWAAGIVGMNFEDSPNDVLLGVEEQVALISAIRAAVPDLVLNARVDVFLNGDGDLDHAVARATAYLAAGAHCVYPILAPVALIADLVDRIDGPVNVILTPKTPSVTDLAALGVARVTWGGGLAAIAYGEAVRTAADAFP
jgi:2-methylisocitrate lyase-like PEP mutase family enzyme